MKLIILICSIAACLINAGFACICGPSKLSLAQMMIWIVCQMYLAYYVVGIAELQYRGRREKSKKTKKKTTTKKTPVATTVTYKEKDINDYIIHDFDE